MRYSCPAYQVAIYEHDDDENHDHIKDLSAEVKDGKVAIPWKVEYHADDDDSNCAKEIAELGYTVPEYFFVVKYNGVEGETGKLLYVKGWVRMKLKAEHSERYLANMEYMLFLPNGETRIGTTNENGEIIQENLPIGERYVLYDE